MGEAAVSTLGRLSVVSPREVWRDEARDFTPWLLDNVDVLSELLGMNLVLEVAEHPVGNFRLDLKGKDEDTDQVVIVENQLEVSNHEHLGQILTYAAGTDPTTIVWIATGFREEHRQAMEWLNNRTDENTRFFAVEIEVVRIGDSAPAPAFKLVAQPNDWAKTVKAATSRNGGGTTREQAYWQFWERFRNRVLAEHPGWTKSAGSTKSSWFQMSAGAPGVNWVSTFSVRGLAVQLTFEDSNRDLNQNRFEELRERRTEFEASYGGPLEWEQRDGLKSTRVSAITLPCNVIETENWDSWIDWLIQTGAKMRAALEAVGGVPSGLTGFVTDEWGDPV